MANRIFDKKIRIGDILVSKKVITHSQLEKALAEQVKMGVRLGKALIALGFVDEVTLLTILSEQLQVPFIKLKDFHYHRAHVRFLRETLARRYRVVVLDKGDDYITLGMSDPTDIFCLDELTRLLGVRIDPVVVRESELLDILDDAYGETEKIASLAEELSDELGGEPFDVEGLSQYAEDSQAPVVRLIKKIFEEALRFNASDIHIEPDEKVLRIRLRIDGVLSEQVMNEKHIASAIVVRLKLISGLDISEKRLPQDGRFHLHLNQKNIDIRISTMPVQYGESIVMRLLVVDDGVRRLDDIGINPEVKRAFKAVLRQPHGLVLVTGPTGSGKTTTLYSALSEINTPDKKIITVEDPIEYRLPRLNQVQIKEKIGLSFSEVLKSVLRQDPDVLLIGEMRDIQSAEIALRAALTGHLVLSTLHTNDAISSALRLLDMGIDPFLMAASLRAIIAQRLVRRLCEHCKVKDNRDHSGLLLGPDQQQQTFYRSKGCPHCFNTGYAGRIGVFEYLTITTAMTDALRDRDIVTFSHLAMASKYYKPLAASALELAMAGETSLDEVQRYSLLMEAEG